MCIRDRGDPVQVSSVHGHGTGDLLDAIFEYFPPETGEEEEEDLIRVAVDVYKRQSFTSAFCN